MIWFVRLSLVAVVLAGVLFGSVAVSAEQSKDTGRFTEVASGVAVDNTNDESFWQTVFVVAGAGAVIVILIAIMHRSTRRYDGPALAATEED